MSFLSLKQLNALWVLGFALMKHLALWPFVRRRVPGPWLKRIAEESLGAVPPRAWELLSGTSRCVGCHLCDICGAPTERPSLWLASAIRQPADSMLSLAVADRLCALAPEIERICPARVPVLNVAELIRENHRMLAVK